MMSDDGFVKFNNIYACIGKSFELCHKVSHGNLYATWQYAIFYQTNYK